METNDTLKVRREWTYRLSVSCQDFACAVFTADRDQFLDATRVFGDRLPPPASAAEALILQNQLRLTTRSAERQLHGSLHLWFPELRCSGAPVGTLRIDEYEPAFALLEWSVNYLAALDLGHHWPAAVRAASVLRRNLARPSLDATALGRQLGCSRSHLVRSFRRIFGLSMQAYRARVRLRRGVRELREPASNVDAVARELGYRSTKNLYEALSRVAGMTPSGIRALGEAEIDRLLESALALPEAHSPVQVGKNNP